MENEQPTQPERNIEIIKKDNYDFILNPKTIDRALQEYLMREVQKGIFSNWKLMQGKLNIWIDSSSKHIAKIRNMVDPSYRKRIAHEMTQQELDTLNLDRDSGYAFASLANELALSPRISALLTSPELAPALSPIGIHHMEYIAPLLGVIMREAQHTVHKVMFYNYVDGMSLAKYKWLKRKEQNPITDDHFESDLKDFFLKHGIQPGDLSAKQFLVSSTDGVNVLHLLDTEGYRAKQ